MNNTISITKGIAIILMVVGHAGCPDPMRKFIYAFHMPLFFFVSGYLFNSKYLSTPFDFTKRKIKGLYVPFVKWNLIFILLHNIFYSVGIYTDSYSYENICSRIIKLFTFIPSGSEQLLGGFWFIKELFFVSFGCYTLLFVIQLFEKRREEKSTLLLISLMLCLTLSYLRGVFDLDIFPSLISSRTFFAGYMFLLGYQLRISNIEIKGWMPIILGYGICILVVYLFPNLSLSMMNLKGYLLLPYTIIATAGVFATYALSAKIIKVDNLMVHKLIDIGTKTLYILIFHFLSLRLVSFLIIKLGYDGSLSDFPVIPNLGGLWWILYSIVGVLLPLLIWNIVQYMSIYWSKAVNYFKK